MEIASILPSSFCLLLILNKFLGFDSAFSVLLMEY